MSSSDVMPPSGDPIATKGQGPGAFVAIEAPLLAGGQSEVKLDATIGDMRLEAREDVPEIFITLQVLWNGKTQEIVLGESDRYFNITASSETSLTLFC